MGAVITDPATHRKIDVVSPLMAPRLALVDPEVTVTLPPGMTAATGMDALTHSVEGYTATLAHPLTDAIHLQAIGLLGKYLLRAYRDGADKEARYHTMMASMIAGIGFPNSGLGAVHGLALPLGGHFNIAHGVANAILLPHVMAFNLPASRARLRDIAVALGAPRKSATGAIDHVFALRRELKLPLLASFGVGEEHLDALARDALGRNTNCVTNPRPVTEADAKEIYRAACENNRHDKDRPCEAEHGTRIDHGSRGRTRSIAQDFIRVVLAQSRVGNLNQKQEANDATECKESSRRHHRRVVRLRQGDREAPRRSRRQGDHHRPRREGPATNRRRNPGIEAITPNATRWEDWQELFAFVMAKHGRVNILVNNAGGGVAIADTVDQTVEAVDEIIALNLNSVVYGSMIFGKQMQAQGSGTIINISSTCATEAWPGFSVYAAAKSGVVSLSKGMYTELRPFGVRVTAVIPGAGATNFSKNAGLAEPPTPSSSSRKTWRR